MSYSDSRGLAPEEWRVPSVDDWATLISYLGGHAVAGGKLKEEGTDNWNDPNVDASNSTGFTAVASGFKRYFLA